MKGKLLGVWLSALVAAGAAGGEVGEAEGGYEQIKASFAAYLVLSNERSKFKERQSVVLSPAGVKLKGDGLFGRAGGGAYIANFERDVSWIVDLERRIYAQVPDGLTEEDSGLADSSGIMSTAPCLGADHKRQADVGERELNASVEHYVCEHEGVSVHQYYDTTYGVVIKEIYPSGDVFQLANLRPVNFNDAFFSPPDEYQEVEIQEFYTGLSAYEPLAEAE